MTVKRLLKRPEPVQKPKRMKKEYVFKKMSTQTREQTLLPIEALLYAVKDKPNNNQYIELKLQLVKPMVEDRVFIPIILNIPNKIRTSADTKILLVTNDPAEMYKGDLERENCFTEIIGCKRFKTLLNDSKKAKDIHKNFDLIMLDYRSRTRIRKLIDGTALNKSNRRLPLLIQLTNPETDELDVDHVLKQASSLCKNTSYVPATGKSISVLMGKRNMSSKSLLENMDSILYQLKSKTKIEKMFLACDDITLPIVEEEEHQ